MSQPLCFKRVTSWLLIVALNGLCSGCIAREYRYGHFHDSFIPPADPSINIVTLDPPHPRLDRIERTLFRPLDELANLYEPGSANPQTREERMNVSLITTLKYLDKNDLSDVFVDVRRYNPGAQWTRLRQNQRVHPLVKYTAGSLRWTVETILPGRVFRYSYYNVYTNTLAVNSVWRERNVSEAARAKDYHGAQYPGLYAVAQHIPFVPIYQEACISTDALTYARAEGDRELELNLYPYVYGEIGGSAVSEAAVVIPGLSGLPYYTSPLIWGSSFATGFVCGSAQKSRLEAIDSRSTPNGSADLAAELQAASMNRTTE